MLAIQTVKQSKPDGYALMMASGGSLTITPAVKKDANYKPLEDFTPIAIVGIYPFALVTRADYPANNTAELIEYAKKNPGKVRTDPRGSGRRIILLENGSASSLAPR